MNKKPIYTAFSFYEFLKVIFFWAILAIGFFLLLSVYNENPTVILILLILDVIFILGIGYSQITIYEDRIVMSNISILSIILNSKGSRYYFKEIKSAEFPGPEPVDDLIGVAIISGLLRSMSMKNRTATENDQLSFLLEMKEGASIPVYTRFEQNKIDKIVELINLQITEERWKQ